MNDFHMYEFIFLTEFQTNLNNKLVQNKSFVTERD